MPDPARLIQTLTYAARYYRSTPHRRGRLVELRDADEVLVSGDLHGNLGNFQRILRLADLGNHPRRHLVLQEVIHGSGDSPSGVDRSHQLFDVVAALKCQFPLQVHLLPGNHEMAQFTDRPVIKGDRDLNRLFREGITVTYGAHADAVYEAYRELFFTLPLALRTRNRVYLSHSLPSATRLEAFDPALLESDDVPPEEWHPGGSLYALVWGRDTSPKTVEAFLARVGASLLITGHIPCEEGFTVPNEYQIILDSMAEPAAYCLFPARFTISHAELVKHVALL
jgi:hypothetical protein